MKKLTLKLLYLYINFIYFLLVAVKLNTDLNKLNRIIVKNVHIFVLTNK